MGNERIKILGIFALLSSGILLPYLITDTGSIEQNQTGIISLDEGPLDIWGGENWELQGWPGNGTEISPYLVENMTLTGVQIHHSDVFFIIRNCLCDVIVDISSTNNGKIEDSTFNDQVLISDCSDLMISNVTLNSSSIQNMYSPPDTLVITSSERITIEDCIIRDSSSYGLIIEDSANCTIQRNTISNCGMLINITPNMAMTSSPEIHSSSFDVSQYSWPSGGGLNVKNSLMCFISDNTISNNIGYGTYCHRTNNSEIRSNFEESNGLDTAFLACQENEIVDNTFNSGLALIDCTAFIVTRNEIGANGLELRRYTVEYYYFHDISNNSVLSKPLLFLVNASDTTHSNAEYGQIFVINSVRVSLSQIDVSASSPSITILYSPFCVVTEAVCSSIDIDHSNNVEIHKSDITGGFSGIRCYVSPECQINNNTIRDTTFGINLHSNSHESLIYDNKVIDVSRHGIYVSSHNCTIENNTVSGCATPVEDIHWGITQHYAGITIGSSNCSITNNTVTNNHCYGIWVNSYGRNNTLYSNRLSENEFGNGQSDGEGNQWDNGIDTGNYWGDWSGVGVYNVPGDEGCVDRFPNGTTSSLISLTTAILMLSAGFSLIIIGLVIVRIVKFKAQNK